MFAYSTPGEKQGLLKVAPKRVKEGSVSFLYSAGAHETSVARVIGANKREHAFAARGPSVANGVRAELCMRFARDPAGAINAGQQGHRAEQ